MNALIVSKQMKRAAGVAALVATMFTTGGTLALADHYASTGGDARAYIAGGSAVPHAAAVLSGQADAGRVAVSS
jgi:hypothetical protein